jgi:hypothetical protein
MKQKTPRTKVEGAGIKTVLFDAQNKTLRITTEDDRQLLIKFLRDIHFDVTLKMAMIQNGKPAGYIDHNEITAIINEVNERAKTFAPARRKEYGSLRSARSFETCWQRYFRHKERKYTIIKENQSDVSRSQIKKILSNVFSGKGRKEDAIFIIGYPHGRIGLPRQVYEDQAIYVGPKESYLGERNIPWFTCVVDTERGLSKEDVRISFIPARIDLPTEINEYRSELLNKRRIALSSKTDTAGQTHWPGPTFAIQSFLEDRSPIAEHATLYLSLRPTDYFTFLAVQYAIKNPLVKDGNGQPQVLKERYLSDYNPFVPIPQLAQSISGTILLICKGENDEQQALIFKRSKRVATGMDVYVLSVNETPKRKPTPEEVTLFEDVPPELIKPDLDQNGNPCIFAAIVRGAKEELGINLPIESIRILSFGVETDRYQYAMIGIAETDLVINQVKSAFNEAKDKPFEYSGFAFVPFKPEDIYEFMRNKKWGPEAEIGLYQALVYKFGSEHVQRVFKDYPKPLIGISRTT